VSKKKENANPPEDDLIDELPDLPREDAVGYAEGVAAPATDSGISVDELKALAEQAQKDNLYLRAEFDNYRRQAIKERASLARYAGEKLARDLLDTLDIFDKALAGEVTAENFKDFAQGINLTAQNLRATLNRHGIIEVPSEGQPFDPSMHEALANEPTDKIAPGHITQVFKKPYKYHDKVLRVGQVVVAKQPEDQPPEV
jgi:molecular chaperone GrpE